MHRLLLSLLIAVPLYGACDADSINEAVANNDEAAVRACTQPTPMGVVETNCSSQYNQCLQSAANTAQGASDCLLAYRQCDTPAYEPGNHLADPGPADPFADPSFRFNNDWTDSP
ncbi:MAG: hypothetical protein KDD51_14185 [Bdellovibrionales bacterium]|nr:hypothetical protein [Bdellovibrionales bacterium]